MLLVLLSVVFDSHLHHRHQAMTKSCWRWSPARISGLCRWVWIHRHGCHAVMWRRREAADIEAAQSRDLFFPSRRGRMMGGGLGGGTRRRGCRVGGRRSGPGRVGGERIGGGGGIAGRILG